MNRPITAEMDLEDVASITPKAIRLLTERNIVCIACGTPLWKTVGEAIQDAGLDNVDVIVAEVNAELAAVE
ncbi:MAG TPA: hypothetical protein ENH10_09585 [Bacteroidetes bacterium]|nr:hypothetical protein [Bacteroidota bacterium]HEX05384.1 hypothetical protein [Bacteroidota bacterium]